MKKRDNNFTTAELKRIAKDDCNFYQPPNYTNKNVDEDLIKIATENGWKFEKTPREDEEGKFDIEEFSDLSTFDMECELRRMLSILAWKILYERRLHKEAMDILREQIICAANGISYVSNVSSDDNDEIEEGDEEDYYDEFEFKPLKKDEE